MHHMPLQQIKPAIMCANSLVPSERTKSLLTDISRLINDSRKVFVFSCTRMHSMQKLQQDSRDHPLGKHTLQQTQDMFSGLECACPCGTVFCPAPNLHSKPGKFNPSFTILPRQERFTLHQTNPASLDHRQSNITKDLNLIKA